jgi:hypothetical protein
VTRGGVYRDTVQVSDGDDCARPVSDSGRDCAASLRPKTGRAARWPGWYRSGVISDYPSIGMVGRVRVTRIVEIIYRSLEPNLRGPRTGIEYPRHRRSRFILRLCEIC